MSGESTIGDAKSDKFSTKLAMAQMLHGGVAVEVTCLEEARTAASAGARCVVVGGPRKKEISRRADLFLIEEMMKELPIPVMVKVRVGHFVEAGILQSIGVRYIDESEIEGIADQNNFIDKRNLQAAFACGCRDLGDALRRVKEGAVMVRTQGDSSGSGDIVDTVSCVRKLMDEIGALVNMAEVAEVSAFSQRIDVPYDMVSETRRKRKLPAVVFASGGITSPADAALMMNLGCDGVFLGKEVFGFAAPVKRIKAIVTAVAFHDYHTMLMDVTKDLD